MAAGLGFKTFTTGEVLTAADTNGYLMQGILVFASAAARDAAITSPQEGQFAYLKDTNVTTYYTGSAWANVDTTGMTNPMTTTGDTIYSSSGSTPARLGIGSTGQVLTVAAGVPSWATPAGGGGMTLLNSGGTALSGSSITISSISQDYINLYLVIKDVKFSANNIFNLRLNGDTGNNYKYIAFKVGQDNTTFAFAEAGVSRIKLAQDQGAPSGDINGGQYQITIPRYTDTSAATPVFGSVYYVRTSGTDYESFQIAGVYDNSAAITSLTLAPAAGTFSSGTAYLYGVK
jgi:hypothetical protein